MLWLALRLPASADASLPSPDALRGIAIWALQFTPRVAVLDECVVAEVEASVRLFGGKRALRDRILIESKELGVEGIAWSTTAWLPWRWLEPGSRTVSRRRPMNFLTVWSSRF